MTFAADGSINRYYDPSVNQFLSVDPDVQTTDEPYVFTNDDPLNVEDPLGLSGYVGVPTRCTKNCGGDVVKAVVSTAAKTAEAIVKHPGDVVTVIAIATCIAGSAGLCAGLTVVALGARVAQRSEEGVPLNSPSNYLDASITAASFGLLSGPVNIGMGAVEDSPGASLVLRIHASLPDVFGWTTGEITHRDIP
jgi:hypothetical protein